MAFASCDKKPATNNFKPFPAKQPAYGDILVRGDIGDASNLIPLLASDTASHNICGMVYNGLVKYDKDMNTVGDLAESWDISPNGLVITFHLRKGIKWHDGHPFTSADVLYTYQITIDPKTPTAYAGDFLKVKKVEAPDDYTFRVIYDKPFAPALISWGSAILPRHLLAGKDITKSALARHPSAPVHTNSRNGSPDRKSSLFPILIILKDNPILTAGLPELFPIQLPCFWNCARRTSA
jgi:peptide/nickel transport system substrate-binding protein